MRTTYRQNDAGPIVNLARHPRGTDIGSSTGKWPKWQVDRWGGDGTYSYLTGITGHPDGITTAIRFTTTTTVRNSHGFHLSGNPEQNPPGIAISQMVPVQPGERLTLSCWLRYTGTATQAHRIRVRPTNPDGSAWVDNGVEQNPYTTLPSGVWVRLSFTYTVPNGAGFVGIYVTNNNGIVDAINDTLDGTGLMVTRTPPPRANIASDPYATKIGVPNNAWGWSAQWFGQDGTGTTTPIVDADDGPNGIRTYLRKQWTTIGTNLSNIAFNHGGTARVNPGDQITVRSWFRPSKGWTLDPLNNRARMTFQWRDNASVQIGSSVTGPNLASGVVTAGVWHMVEFTATAPAGAVMVFVYQDVSMPLSLGEVGDTIDGTGLVVTQTPTRWRFADGNSPGWKWLGAVNTSESAGYPVPG